jgi:hypothetical protein
MSEQDRQRRLGAASTLQESIRSLGKVSEGHRIGFVHDRLMSAIDDICTKHQKANSTKFTSSQIVILKDIAFAMVYILDPKNNKSQGFTKRLWTEFKEQGPLKQIGLTAGAMATLAAAIGGIYTAVQTARPYVEPYIFGKSDKLQARPQLEQAPILKSVSPSPNPVLPAEQKK